MRSTARVVTSDQTYFGLESPQWTYTCEQIGNIINSVQHWIYTTGYFDVALVARHYFGASNTLESLETISRREKALSSFNAALYVIYFGVFVADFFIDTDILQTALYAILSGVMTVALGYSFRKLTHLLDMIRVRGIIVRKKTIFAQLIMIGVITVLSLAHFATEEEFWDQCNDQDVETTYAGYYSRIFDMVVLILWRLMTVAMCTFYVGYAHKNAFQFSVQIAEELQRAICIEDDELFIIDEESDEDSESSSSSEEGRKKSKRSRRYQSKTKRQERRKRELLATLLSVTKGEYKKPARASTVSSMATVDINALNLLKSKDSVKRDETLR